jgi:hypothetical protein
MTAYPYPHDLIFDLAVSDDCRAAIARAAEDLGLSTSTDGARLRVTVRSPQETYRFGQRTGHYLEDGATPPAPIAPAAGA